MTLVNESILSATLDAVNEVLFWSRAVAQADREQSIAWIVGRQGQPGGYLHSLPAPCQADLGGNARVFTGERLSSWAGTAHVLGEEACRALLLLDGPTASAQAALQRASAPMVAKLGQVVRPGEYCCGTCSVSVWRHMAAGGLDGADQQCWLEGGLRTLVAHRTGDGRWRRYPFYYTVLALTEIGLPGAREELRYAAPALERAARRDPGQEVYAVRRRALAERALAQL